MATGMGQEGLFGFPTGLTILACTASEISLAADSPKPVLSIAILCLVKHY